MATLTTTTATTTISCAVCGWESGIVELFSFASIWQAYLACRRRKRGTTQSQLYEAAVLDRVASTTLALQNQNFLPSRSVCFIAKQPKAREIHAATFADRVVHHLLVPHLEILFEPVFIYDLYSNRKGKGTHAAVDRLQNFMRSLTGDGQNAYFLQLDISNFFNSINRRLLVALIKYRILKSTFSPIDKTRLLWLTQQLLTANPATTAFHQGNLKDFARVPSHKRLINAPPETGLPIGNLTSQFFANVYLNELDQFVKHQLKCKYYLRYVDDFILLHHDTDQLRIWRQAIEHFLFTQLKLQLKELSEPKLVTNGSNFLGYIIRPHYRLIRRRVVGNLRAKLDIFSRLIIPKPGILRLELQVREQLRATLASYLGHFRHANSRHLKIAIWKRYPWLYELFKDFNEPLIPRWEPPMVTSLMSQWTYFTSNWTNTLVLIQIGRRLKCFDQKLDVPMRQRNKLLKRLRKQNIAYILVLEEGYLKCGLKRRILFESCMNSVNCKNSVNSDSEN